MVSPFIEKTEQTIILSESNINIDLGENPVKTTIDAMFVTILAGVIICWLTRKLIEPKGE